MSNPGALVDVTFWAWVTVAVLYLLMGLLVSYVMEGGLRWTKPLADRWFDKAIDAHMFLIIVLTISFGFAVMRYKLLSSAPYREPSAEKPTHDHWGRPYVRYDKYGRGITQSQIDNENELLWEHGYLPSGFPRN